MNTCRHDGDPTVFFFFVVYIILINFELFRLTFALWSYHLFMQFDTKNGTLLTLSNKTNILIYNQFLYYTVVF